MRISKCGMALGLGIALLGATGSAQAAGFKVNEQGAKAMAMANAFTAQVMTHLHCTITQPVLPSFPGHR